MHAVSRTFEPFLDGHNRQEFEIYGYGNIARIKDVGRVLWDYNVVGRAIDSVKSTAQDFDKATKHKRQSFMEKLKSRKSSEKAEKKTASD